MTFNEGETAICSIEVTNTVTGDKADPTTSMTITIYLPSGAVDINEVSMTKDAVGEYHYDYDTSSKPVGHYEIEYIATNNSRVCIARDSFKVK